MAPLGRGGATVSDFATSILPGETYGAIYRRHRRFIGYLSSIARKDEAPS